ncbi:MAG TPA: PepSY domain-containing protein [Oculatellaceae cyanobacterium]
MKTSTKIALTAALLGTLSFGGLARSVYAEKLQSQVATMPQHRSNTLVAEASDGDGEENDATEAPENAKQLKLLTITNSRSNTQVAEASDGDGETNDDVEEQQEAAKLQSLAKITPQQAQKAAETAKGGTANHVKLENEDGNLVYAVKIGQQEVKVDAGNGQVLYIENANQEDKNSEASRPRSSIQVTDTSDGDGETNDDGGK